MDNERSIAVLDTAPGLDARRIGVRAAQIGAVVVLAAAAIAAFPGLSDVRGRFADASPGWLAAIAAAEIVSCLAFVAAFRGVFCRKLSWRLSYEIGMTEQAANVLLATGGAGGLALGAWALRRGGMSAERVARRSVAFYLITSSPNFFAAMVFGGLVGAGVFPASGGTVALALVPAGLAMLAIAAVVALPRVLPTGEPAHEGRVRRWLHVASGALAGGIEDTRALLRAGHPLVILGTAAYMAFDVLALAAAFEAFGGGAPNAGTFVLAYTIGQLGALIPLPGGVGGTDGGLVAVFVLYGTPLGAATAAVLAYRAFQLGLPALLGAAAFRSLPRTLARDNRSAAGCEPDLEPASAHAP